MKIKKPQLGNSDSSRAFFRRRALYPPPPPAVAPKRNRIGLTPPADRAGAVGSPRSESAGTRILVHDPPSSYTPYCLLFNRIVRQRGGCWRSGAHLKSWFYSKSLRAFHVRPPPRPGVNRDTTVRSVHAAPAARSSPPPASAYIKLFSGSILIIDNTPMTYYIRCQQERRCRSCPRGATNSNVI